MAPTHIHGKPFSFSGVPPSLNFSTLTAGPVHLGKWLFIRCLLHLIVIRFLSAQKMTSSNSRCATFTNEADGYVYNRSLYNSFLSLALDMFHRRVLLASFSRPKVRLYATAIIFLLLSGLQMSSTMADLKDWSLPMLKPKLPCRSRSSRKPI